MTFNDLSPQEQRQFNQMNKNGKLLSMLEPLKTTLEVAKGFESFATAEEYLAKIKERLQ